MWPHTAQKTTNDEEMDWKVLQHIPYNPELAPGS
jgi:hypothetical protein